MKQIYKYTLPMLSSTLPNGGYGNEFINIPGLIKILTIQFQNDQLCIWAEVNTHAYESKTISISAYGTGNGTPEDAEEYMTTIQINDYVWHIYQESL